jgi:hypothetical protein
MPLRHCPLTISFFTVRLIAVVHSHLLSILLTELVEYDPLVYNLKHWSNLDDLEFEFSLPSLSNPLELEPELQISPHSSTSSERPFNNTALGPSVASRYLNNQPTTVPKASSLVSTNLYQKTIRQ